MAMAASMTITSHDIISTHILHLLPSKSIGRFRCVSKEWLSLLTQPQFIQTHQKTLNTYRFIFESNDGLRYSVPCYNHEAVSTLTKLMLPLKLHNLNTHGSVTGLVLASAYKNLNAKDYTILVLNLTTKDYVELPISSHLQYSDRKGFGYDSVSDDYKVVTIDKYYGNVYVYNLRTNTWKECTHSPYSHNIITRSGVFVNGFLHWIIYSHPKLVIVAFSLADEKFTEVPLPNEVDTVSELNMGYMKLVALGEKQLSIYNEAKGDVWLMNEYGVHTSWTKIICGFNQIPMCRPIVFSGNGKFLFLTRDLLWIYDVEERTFCKTVDVSYMKISYFVGACAESLVSPKFSISK